MNLRPLLSAVVAAGCLASVPVLAQNFPPGNDGWTTQSSNTQINLSAMPVVSQALGAPVSGSGIINLAGVPLNSSQFANVDTITGRSAISGGKGTASIVALNLAGASPVQLTDGRSYALQVCLSPGATQPQGTVTAQAGGSNTGNLTTSFSVVPLLVFTNTNNPNDVVQVDCASGACPQIQLTTQNAPYVVASQSQATASGIGTLPSGKVSVANCGSALTPTLAGTNNLYAGTALQSSGKLGPVNIQVTSIIIIHFFGPFITILTF
jgi:hypothetical protein